MEGGEPHGALIQNCSGPSSRGHLHESDRLYPTFSTSIANQIVAVVSVYFSTSVALFKDKTDSMMDALIHDHVLSRALFARTE